jgi:hypothetical protein
MAADPLPRSVEEEEEEEEEEDSEEDAGARVDDSGEWKGGRTTPRLGRGQPAPRWATARSRPVSPGRPTRTAPTPPARVPRPPAADPSVSSGDLAGGRKRRRGDDDSDDDYDEEKV